MPSNKRPSSFARFVAEFSPLWIHRAGSLLGLMFYAVDRPHRRIVKRNLNFAYPGAPPALIRTMARGVFSNLGITLLEMVKMTCWSPEDLLRHVRVEGKRHLLGALVDGRGAIVVSAHIGNWEVALAFAACFLGVPITAIVKRMRFNPLDRRLNDMRTRFGTRIRYKQQAMTEMMNVIKRGEALALLIDQSKRSEGVPATFFGARVVTTSVVALLARRYKSPVVPVFCIREPGGGLTIRVEPPLRLARSKELRSDLQQNAQLMTAVVEKVIREYPRQWFWFHKRWKNFYPQLYPEYFRRRSRRKFRENRRAPAVRKRIG
jgi:KDO2-lipid IV(A) lauroyltransferase